MRARWPARECLHQETSSEKRIVNGWGELIRIVPERCRDCLSRRDPNTGQWIPSEGAA